MSGRNDEAGDEATATGHQLPVTSRGTPRGGARDSLDDRAGDSLETARSGVAFLDVEPPTAQAGINVQRPQRSRSLTRHRRLVERLSGPAKHPSSPTADKISSVHTDAPAVAGPDGASC